MARRRYQRGYVFLRGKKGQQVWVGRYLEGIEKRINRSVVLGPKSEIPTRKAAKSLLEPYLAIVNDRNYRPSTPISFRRFAEDWQTSMMGTVRKKSYQKDIKIILQKYLIPALGDRRLNDLDTHTLQRLISQISPGRQPTVYMAFRKLWKTAGDWGYVKHEIKGIQLTPYQKKEPRFFMLEEVRAIFGHAEEPWKTLYWLAIETGLRIGELLAIRVRSLDLNRHLLMVGENVWEGKFGAPKTSRGVRILPMSFGLSSHLSTRVSSKSPEHLLFSSSKETALREGNILKRHHYPFLDRLGIPRGGFHAFRHASASFMDLLNTPIQIRQKRLGHADISTTMRYTHSISVDERRVSEEIGEFLNLSSPKLLPETTIST